MDPLRKSSRGPFLFIPLGSIAGRDSVFASLSRPRRVSTRRLSLTALAETRRAGLFSFCAARGLRGSRRHGIHAHVSTEVPPAAYADPVFGAAMADSGPASPCTSRNGMHILKLQPRASAFSLALPRFPTIAFVLMTLCVMRLAAIPRRYADLQYLQAEYSRLAH